MPTQLLKSLRKEHPSKKRYPQTVETSTILSDISKANINEILQSLNTSPKGLSEEEAKNHLKRYGLNEVVHQKRAKWYVHLLSNIKTPFNLLLIGIAIISYFTHSIDATIIISVMVMLSVFLRFIQESRSSNAAEELQALVSTTATVYRKVEGEDVSVKQEIPLKNLVPGDIIHLSSGDMIPADVRLLSSKDLLVAEAVLTGESMPVEKRTEAAKNTPLNQFELSNVCFMGTNVVSGTATAVVVLTGPDTCFGALSKDILGHDEPTSFDKGLTQLSWLLIRFVVVLVSLIFLINGINKGNWFEAFMFALSVAVGLTPEMLPMIVTANLAKGALAMSKKKVIVKRLNSIQNFGAMDILCTDKTGTLTQNRIILKRPLNIHGTLSEKVMKYAYLNSYYQTGLKNILDEAVLQHAQETRLTLDEGYTKVDEIPFDFERRRMSVIVEKDHNTHLLICKGAVEEIFKVSSRVEDGDSIEPVDAAVQDYLSQGTRDLNEDGFRVIALAYKELPLEKTEYTAADETDLILLGYVSFLDPPKETAALAIAALKQYGVHVKILTGDNDAVTQKVCKDVGLEVTNIVLGHQIEQMPDKKLAEIIDQANVFAKLTPKHKERIIYALREKGHVVGFLGDGINDAPALKAADVGISVDSAVDIAKESADIILLEKSLLVLEEGVIEGRMVFGNIMKYIRMTMSSNFGNVFSMVGASAILPFLPMLPIHILIQNLLYDFSQLAIPIDKVDEEYLTKPRKWEMGHLTKFMLFFGPTSSIFDYATFALLWFVFGANTIAKQSLFQSGWFVEGLLSQTLIIHMIRTSKVPFLQSWAATPLTILTVLIMAIGIYIPFSPFAHAIGLMPLPLPYFYWLALILVSYCVLTQGVKRWFINQYGYN